MFGVEKLEWWGYVRLCSAVSIEYRRVTDRQIDRQSDILRQHSPHYAYASRSKNGTRYSYSYNGTPI